MIVAVICLFRVFNLLYPFPHKIVSALIKKAICFLSDRTAGGSSLLSLVFRELVLMFQVVWFFLFSFFFYKSLSPARFILKVVFDWL